MIGFHWIAGRRKDMIISVESLPRTPYGKVVKGELRERYETEKDGDDRAH